MVNSSYYNKTFITVADKSCKSNVYKELKKNKNNLQKYSHEKLKQFRHVVDRICALLGETDCGSRNDTSPRANQKQLYCRSFYHKRTSAMAAGSDEVASGGQAVPPTQSIGGRSRTPLRSLPPPSVGTQPLGNGGHV